MLVGLSGFLFIVLSFVFIRMTATNNTLQGCVAIFGLTFLVSSIPGLIIILVVLDSLQYG